MASPASTAAPHSPSAPGNALRVDFGASPPLYGLPPLHITEVQPDEVARFRYALTRPSKALPNQRSVPEQFEDAFRNARMILRACKVRDAIAATLRRVEDPSERARIEAVYGSVYLQRSMMTIAMHEVARKTVDRLAPWRQAQVDTRDSDTSGYLEKALSW